MRIDTSAIQPSLLPFARPTTSAGPAAPPNEIALEHPNEKLLKMGSGKPKPPPAPPVSYPAPPPPPPPAELTLEGLMKDWGKGKSPYDFNKDGMVDTQDLMTFLARAEGDAPPITKPMLFGTLPAADEPKINPTVSMPGPGDPAGPTLEPADDGVDPTIEMTTSAPATPTTSAGETPPAEEGPLTIQGLLEAWGQTDSRYDLNQDGRVDMEDLLHLLAKLGGGMGDQSGPMTIEGLMEAWGQADSPYDVNGDGTVDSLDLLQLLAKLGGSAPAEASAPADAALTTKAAAQPAALAAVGATLADQLSAAGFKERPPVELDRLLDALDLNSKDRKTLLAHVAARYPDGLGVNMVG